MDQAGTVGIQTAPGIILGRIAGVARRGEFVEILLADDQGVLNRIRWEPEAFGVFVEGEWQRGILGRPVEYSVPQGRIQTI